MAAAPTIHKTDEEWQAVLSPKQFRILRQKGTEPAGTGEYEHTKDDGVYECAACHTPLYKSTTKFSSGCGWPAFFDAIPGAVSRHTDNSFGMARTEITCTACGGHLGHVFKGEKFGNPIDERHCVNSISLKFNEGDPDALAGAPPAAPNPADASPAPSSAMPKFVQNILDKLTGSSKPSSQGIEGGPKM